MVERGRKIDEGKNRAGKGREIFSLPPQSPLVFFPLVFLFAFAAYDLTCSPLSKRLEQAKTSGDAFWSLKRYLQVEHKAILASANGKLTEF